MTNQKIALITGGARGIGRAAALDLASSGWSVAICYRTSAREAAEVSDAMQQAGVDTLALQSDVSDPDRATDLVRQVNQQWGRIDALIHGAGPYHRVSLLKETNEGWHSMFDNNLHPVFYLTQAVIPIMRERKWGRIVCFSMANAEQLIAQPQLTAHYLAKVGVLGLVRTLSKSLARHHITVNAISPGFIDSGSMGEEELKATSRNIPAGYVGSTADTSSVALYLLSDEAGYVTGANIPVSGGWGW